MYVIYAEVKVDGVKERRFIDECWWPFPAEYARYKKRQTLQVTWQENSGSIRPGEDAFILPDGRMLIFRP